jgi:hypothetical protein
VFNAGAQEYCSHPVDLEPIFIKLETFLNARSELVVARTEDFVNSTTGVYTSLGLRQRPCCGRATAETALDHAPIHGDGNALVSFDDLPVY